MEQHLFSASTYPWIIWSRLHLSSLRNINTEEGILSPLAQSLLVAFYDKQRILWHNSFGVIAHPNTARSLVIARRT